MEPAATFVAQFPGSMNPTVTRNPGPMNLRISSPPSFGECFPKSLLTNMVIIIQYTPFLKVILIAMFKRSHDLFNPDHNPFIFNEPATLDDVRLLFGQTLRLIGCKKYDEIICIS